MRGLIRGLKKMRSSHIEQLFENNDIPNLRKCNYYDLLGVNKNATDDALARAVTKQYRQLALRFHPDLYKNDATKTEMFKLISEAYSTLNDTQKRMTYNSTLNEEFTASAGNAASFFYAPENETPVLSTDTYCFFHTQMNDWQAFGYDANITVTNKKSNMRFTLSGHILPVKCLVFSQNERYLASADMNNVIKIWDLTSQQCLQSFTANTTRISHLFFSENSEWLFSGEENVIFDSTRKIEVWDFKNGKNLGLFSGFYHEGETAYGDPCCSGYGVTHLAISPDGKVVTGTMGDTVKKDANGKFVVKPYPRATTGCANEIIVPIWPDAVAKPVFPYGYAFNALKSHVLVREQLTVTLWDLKTETLLVSLQPILSAAQKQEDCRVACAFNPVDNTFAVGIGSDVRIVDYQGREHQRFSDPGVIEKLSYTPDGKFLISKRRRSVLVNACETRKPHSLLDRSIEVRDVCISSDSQKILVISDSHKHNIVEIFSIIPRARLFRQELQYDGVKNPRIISFGADVRVFHSAFSKDSQTVALGLDDHSVRLIDVATSEMFILRGHQNDVMRVAFSPDNRWLVTSSRDNTIRVWDYHQRTLMHQFSSQCAMNIIFVNEHRFLFDAGKQIKTWDIEKNKIDDVCIVSLSYGKALHYADYVLFFENERRQLIKIDISAVLRRLENPMMLRDTATPM